MEKNYKNDRREFMKKAGAVLGFGVFGTSFATIFNSCQDNEVLKYNPQTVDVDITQYPELSSPGGIVRTSIELEGGNRKNIIILRESSNQFKAYDAVCYHQGALINVPNSLEGDFVCSKHHAVFSTESGEVLDNKGFNVPPMVKISVYDFTGTTLKLQL